IDIGIFALGVIPKKSKKLDRGLIGEVLVLNGIYVQQGDWVYCDKNGVIISKQEIK
ncbi:MAG: putative 4-hydroxy-4-methyl-2-oxoglutarate aldolase, partial [Gammaproteobacteria bacterium]|nr:putative 4-hydroxy-4-methyl-2-oxoglutarate aldolase [Gammaproteobacteria bacterium]